jgi:small subunit ribosomal protein S12
MPTLKQIITTSQRKTKKTRIRMPALKGNPQVKAVCIKIYNRTPKKPNSALRKVAKVKTSTGKKVECYITGEGHTLHQYSVVLVRGGRTPDLPGVKYRLIRNKYDLKGVKNRKTSRSKYGVKNVINKKNIKN